MPAYPATRIIPQQSKNQHPQRMFLPLGTRILRPSFTVKSALVTNADTFTIETFRMRSDFLYRPGRLDIPVLPDIEMIPRPVESPSAMADIQVIFRKVFVLACSGTVDYYQVYRSHNFRHQASFKLMPALPVLLRCAHSLLTHCKAAACANCPRNEKISVCISFTLELRSK